MPIKYGEVTVYHNVHIAYQNGCSQRSLASIPFILRLKVNMLTQQLHTGSPLARLYSDAAQYIGQSLERYAAIHIKLLALPEYEINRGNVKMTGVTIAIAVVFYYQ